MDRVLLGFLVSTSVLGHYEVAIKLTMPAMFIAGVAQDGLMGRVSNLRSRGEAVAPDIRHNVGIASVLGVPLFFGALVLAEPIVVTLYSNQYADAAPFLIGLALFRLFDTQKSILVATINGFDRPNRNLRISTAVFAFNLVTGVALLYAIGPIGIVVATVVSEMIAYAARARVVRSMAPSVDLVPRLLLDQLVSGLVMAAVVYGARLVVPLRHWPAVVALVGLGVAVYGVTLVTISDHFRATVRAIAADAGLYSPE
jgi:O-antigen/teichoic acid export membrane protein